MQSQNEYINGYLIISINMFTIYAARHVEITYQTRVNFFVLIHR